MKDITKSLSQLSPSKQELLQKMLQAKQGTKAASLPPTILRSPSLEEIQPSFSQEQLWLLEQLEPGNISYTIAQARRLKGTFHLDAFIHTIQTIVLRHEALRTTFVNQGGRPHPVIVPSLPIAVPVVHLQTLANEGQEAEIERLLQQEVRKPFDLAQGPLLRILILRLSPHEHVLLLTIHHIIADGRSIDVLMRDMTILYNAFVQHRPSPLSELPIQYSDFAYWQRQRLQGPLLANQLTYWRKQLADIIPLVLPTDYPRPIRQTFHGAHSIFLLPRLLLDQVKALAQSRGLTLFTLLLASLQTLLYRMTGQRDIAIGSPIANRMQPEVEELVGYFVNILVMRIELQGQLPFNELLERVRQIVSDAFAHQDLPFTRLVAELQSNRDLSYAPLFQVMLTLQDAAMAGMDLQLAGLTLDTQFIESGTARFDLTFELVETEQGLHILSEYNTDLFKESSIKRLVERWQLLLQAVVTTPSCRLDDLPLLTSTERQQVLVEWNTQPLLMPNVNSLTQLIEAQAVRTPDQLAVVTEDGALSYQKLLERAWHLAADLQQRGIGPEDLVGICLKRSLRLPEALLGVLLAGAAYVPLDPGYPAGRLGLILRQARPKLVLTEENQLSLLNDAMLDEEHAASRPQIVLFERRKSSEVAPFHEVMQTCEQLAYVLFTSGSTGQPKGVAISHGSVLALMAWIKQAVPLHVLAGMLASTSINFDLSVFELFGPLCWGGTSILVESVLQLPRLAESGRVQLVNSVPSLMNELMNTEAMVFPTTVQIVTLAGEALPRRLVCQLYGVGDIEQVWNLYGPTEDTTYSTWTHVYQDENERQSVSIGRPLPKTQLYLLDVAGQPVGIGQEGEIYLGGKGLARGYLGDPEQTALRFAPDALSGQSGTRLYRTGDRGRYREDGQLEYLGRRDEQVKIHGVRIETGEIEEVLRELELIQECAVVVHEGIGKGDQHLAAYVVLVDGKDEPGWSERIKKALRTRLPEVMVPGRFYKLPHLPRTMNSKINRRKLVTQDIEVVAEQEQTEEWIDIGARTPLEEMLQEMWSQTLEQLHIGAHDNFFARGGHSLSAMRLLTRMRGVFRIELPLRSLFEYPTIAEQARLIEQTLRDQQPLQEPPMLPVSREKPIPLSFAQQRLWFLDQLEPGNVAYAIPLVVRLRNTLQVEALEQSMNEIVQRHESLRTTFQDLNGQPVQVIHPPERLCLWLADLSMLTVPWREREMQRLCQQEAEYPFHLAQGPLIRMALLRLDQTEHILMLTLHHSIADAWSMRILIRELSVFYPSHMAKKTCQLPPLPVQYADYTHWQQSWLQGEVLAVQLAYWTAQLHAVPPLDLPSDYPRPAVPSLRGGYASILLPESLLIALQRISQRADVTLFMTLLAAFQVWLARYSGQTDIAVGTPIANRRRLEVEDVVGFFVNTLVLRTDLSGHPSFLELLKRVRDVALGAYTHQDLPFEKLVEALQPERELSRSPLFQVMFLYQNSIGLESHLGDLELQPLPPGQATSKYDLSFTVQPTADGLLCEAEYSTDLFAPETLPCWLQHWHTLLENIVAQPEQPIDRLSFLSESELHFLHNTWKGPVEPQPQESSLYTLIEERMARTPDALAVREDEWHLTYGQLYRRVNTLAWHLSECNSGPECLIAVCADRSIPWLLAMLAIFKVGATYLPLDPLQPPGRLHQMLRQSHTRTLLVSAVWQPLVSSILANWQAQDGPPPSVFSLERLLHGGNREVVSAPVHPNQLAYIIYTSGSTGMPKGVMVEYAGMLNHILAKSRDIRLSSADIVAQNGPQSFDISIWQSMAALLWGGIVEIIPDEIVLQPALFIQHIQQRAITVLQLVPALLRGMLTTLSAEAQQRPAFPALRWLIPTGDALPPALCQHWWQYYEHIPILNTYGSTECSDDQCHYALTSLTLREVVKPVVSPGSPIINMYAYVLDQALQVVPMGATGELYLGGIGVGRGYLYDPVRTAQAFIPDPFEIHQAYVGNRLYKTGDLVRYDCQGQIEFLGRADQMVKVRGYRIEVEEIETVLMQHPGVHECIVIAREIAESSNAGKQLIGYVVRRERQEPSIEELRAQVRERLPDYMVPNYFVMLEALPLNANGKVDRKHLPAPHPQHYQDDAPRLAPYSPLEEVVIEVWNEVIEQPVESIHANFFVLGGHSLLATKLIARLRRIVGVELSLRCIFEAPTVAGLAKHIEGVLKQGQIRNRPPLQCVPRTGELPLSFAQQRLWLQHQLDPESTAYVIPGAVRLRGRMMVQALEYALHEIILRHESLRTTFHMWNGQTVQRIHPGSQFRLRWGDLGALPSQEREREVQRLVAQEAAQLFDLEQGPLLRGSFLRLSSQEYILLLTMHHLISDGWSMEIFVRELAVLYQSYVTGQASPLAPLLVQYADFALWQRQWLQGEMLNALTAYWTTQLKGAIPLQGLADKSVTMQADNDGAMYTFTLPAPLSQALVELSHQQNVTLFMTLLTAFNVLLYRSTGQQDIIVGTDVANRSESETEDLIGFFVNLLVLRTRVQPLDTFSDVVRNVCTMLLNAYAHQDLSFEKLVEVLQLQRTGGRVPLVNVLFVLQNAPTIFSEIEGLEILPIESETTTAKFDLAVFMRRSTTDLVGFVNYRTNMFDEASIKRLFDHFTILLQSIIAAPDTAIEALTMNTAEEEEQYTRKEALQQSTQRRKLKTAKRTVISLSE